MKIATFAAVMVAASAAFGELIVKDGDTLAFLGDSITAGGQSKPDGYVNLVLRSLALEGVYVKPIKAGIGGHKSDNMLARLDRDVPEFATSFFEKCGLSQCSRGSRETSAIIYVPTPQNTLTFALSADMPPFV